MTVLMNDVKVLAIVDENSKYIDKYIEKLSKSFRGTLYLTYVKDIGFYPAEVLLEFEKSFNKIKRRGLEVLNRIAKRAKELGFKTEILGVHCGIAIERILRLEEQLNPDLILIGYRCGLFRRLLSEDYFDTILCKAKTPILVAR